MARVFVSSTFEDLSVFRSGVELAIRRLGHVSFGMDSYSSTAETPVDLTLRMVAECDVFVGILAWRYGYIPPGYDRSIAELEYRTAVERNKPCLIFLLDEDAPWPRSLVEKGLGADRIMALRAELVSAYLCSFFSTPEELAAQVGVALANRSAVREGPEKVDQIDEERKYQIFMNYRREDTAYQAGWLYGLLSNHFGSEQVFLDISSLELGDPFPVVIAESAASCKILLALIGKEWLDAEDEESNRRLDDSDDFVRREIEIALQSDAVVIPVQFDGAKQLRKRCYPRALRHWLNDKAS